MQKAENEVTNREILSELKDFKKDVSTQFTDLFDVLKKYSEGVDKRFDAIEGRLDGHDQRFDAQGKRLDRIESQMVTKDYFDDKLADLKGELVVLTRKEDKKLVALVTQLRKQKVLTPAVAQKIIAMEPFRQ